MFSETPGNSSKAAKDPNPALPENLPLPEEVYRELGVGSRTTFWRWEKAGLRVLKVGRRRLIYATELRAFLESQDRAAVRCDGGPKTQDAEAPVLDKQPAAEADIDTESFCGQTGRG